MARRKLTLALAPIVAATLAGRDPDDVEAALCAATTELLLERGLHGWTVEDAALRAGVGRTTVYRRFPSRDDLVHEALAAELRRTIAEVGAAVARHDRLEDQVVEAVVVALTALDRSLVDHLLRSDPVTVLPFLTTEAGPLIALARQAFAPALVAGGHAPAGPAAELLAETLARIGLSFVLTRSTALPVDDVAELRATVAAVVGPLLARIA